MDKNENGDLYAGRRVVIKSDDLFSIRGMYTNKVFSGMKLEGKLRGLASYISTKGEGFIVVLDSRVTWMDELFEKIFGVNGCESVGTVIGGSGEIYKEFSGLKNQRTEAVAVAVPADNDPDLDSGCGD